MMTEKEKETFKELFGKYCRQEINKGHCDGVECNWCPIDKAYNEIFYLFNEDAEEDDDE